MGFIESLIQEKKEFASLYLEEVKKNAELKEQEKERARKLIKWTKENILRCGAVSRFIKKTEEIFGVEEWGENGKYKCSKKAHTKR